MNRRKVLGGLDAIDQVVVATLLLDHGGGLVRQHPDFFVAFLTITAGFHHRHDDILGRHERQLASDATLDDLGINHQAFGDVLENTQHDVGREEGFGQRDAAVGRVIQGALHPLHRGGLLGIGNQAIRWRASEQQRSERIGLRL